jgi:hypothetical protein
MPLKRSQRRAHRAREAICSTSRTGFVADFKIL